MSDARKGWSPSIAVITATRNCSSEIATLIAALRAQDDRDFEWIVADGLSTDSTVNLVASSGLTNITITSERDFSIYDALNRAIANCKSDYYMVLGADDVIRPDCIRNYRHAVSSTPVDMVMASVDTFGTVRRPFAGKRWLRGGNAICASHSVGALIRRDLHERFGYYSNRFVNAADMHFILKAASDPQVVIAPGHFVAGAFSNAGVSSVDEAASLSDFFRIQIAMREKYWLQLALFSLRLLRVGLRLKRSGL